MYTSDLQTTCCVLDCVKLRLTSGRRLQSGSGLYLPENNFYHVSSMNKMHLFYFNKASFFVSQRLACDMISAIMSRPCGKTRSSRKCDAVTKGIEPNADITWPRYYIKHNNRNRHALAIYELIADAPCPALTGEPWGI